MSRGELTSVNSILSQKFLVSTTLDNEVGSRQQNVLLKLSLFFIFYM